MNEWHLTCILCAALFASVVVGKGGEVERPCPLTELPPQCIHTVSGELVMVADYILSLPDRRLRHTEYTLVTPPFSNCLDIETTGN
jgi:hypothetical protein